MPAADQPKSLSAFIQRSHSEIIGEFSAFARTLMPPDSPMTDEEMRDHCTDLVGFDGSMRPLMKPWRNQ